ncbi:MAG: YkgJ family cysteine cluster protein [Thermodesulfobacteriota bacterium]
MPRKNFHLQEEIFECQRCGYCCHGAATVSLNDRDLQRMSDYLGLSLSELEERYLRKKGNFLEMKTVDGHCIFYRDNGCTIHPARPWRCRQWPLHPSILMDKANFEAITYSCPGLNAGLGYEKFCEILSQLEDRENR